MVRRQAPPGPSAGTMRARTGIVLAVVAAAAMAMLVARSSVRSRAPAGQRLVDLLASAVEVPPAPERKSFLHLNSFAAIDGRPIGLFVTLEPLRPATVRMRLGDAREKHARAS